MSILSNGLLAMGTRVFPVPSLGGNNAPLVPVSKTHKIRGIDDKKPSSIQQDREFKQAAWAEN